MQTIWQSRIIQTIWNIIGSANIRIKVLGIVLSIILMLGTFVTIQMRQILRPTLTEQLQEQEAAISDQLAHQVETLIVKDDPEALEAYLIERQVHFSDLEVSTFQII